MRVAQKQIEIIGNTPLLKVESLSKITGYQTLHCNLLDIDISYMD